MAEGNDRPVALDAHDRDSHLLEQLNEVGRRDACCNRYTEDKMGLHAGDGLGPSPGLPF